MEIEDTCPACSRVAGFCACPLGTWPLTAEEIAEGMTARGESGDHTFRVTWWLYDRATLERAYPDESDRMWAVKYDTVAPCYGGPGRGFVHAPTVRVSRNRVLVKQVSGLDI